MTEEAGVVESPQPETADITEASTDDIRAALGITPEPEATAEEPAQAESGEVEQPVEEAAHEQEHPQPAVEETAETEEERLAKRRIRPRTAEDQQVIDLYRSEGFEGSFDDAARIIYGQQHQQQAPQAQLEAPQPDPLAEDDAKSSSIQIEISELEKKVAEAAENLDTAEALQLQRGIMRRELQLQTLESRKEREIERRQQERFNTHRNKAEESRDRFFETYPELGDGDSMARKQFDHYVSQAQQDPDYASIFDSPKWPEIMAAQFSALTGGVGAQQLQTPVQAPPQQAPVMGNQARVLTSGTTAQPANSQPTEQQVLNSLPNLSRDDIYAALGQNDGRRYLQ